MYLTHNSQSALQAKMKTEDTSVFFCPAQVEIVLEAFKERNVRIAVADKISSPSTIISWF